MGLLKIMKTLACIHLIHGKEVTGQTPQFQIPEYSLQLCISTECFPFSPIFYISHINTLQNQQVDFSAWFLQSWMIHHEYVITKIQQTNTITKYFSPLDRTFHWREQAETICCRFPHLSIWTEQASCCDSSCCSPL